MPFCHSVVKKLFIFVTLKMKLILSFCIVFLFSTYALIAQQKNVRLNFGLQGNIPERTFNKNLKDYNNKNGGMGFHICPTWRYSKRVSFSINMEYAFVTENYQTDAIGGFDILSFSPTVNYYFTQHKIRPFVGIGTGLYHVLDHNPKFNLGIRPIVGVNFNNLFALSLEYNRILANIVINPRSHGAFDNYYLAVKGSFSLGLFYGTQAR